jgi:hypothetical protein
VQALQRFPSGIASIAVSELRPHTRLGPGREIGRGIFGRPDRELTLALLLSVSPRLSKRYRRYSQGIGLAWTVD